MIRESIRRKSIAVAGALAAMVFVVVAHAGYTSTNPSYQGCTTELFANAFPSGSNDVMYASHDDELGCATRVSARGKYAWDFGIYEAPWHRHATFAQSTTYEPAGFDHGWGQGEIETGTNDWSQIFTTNNVFP